jgi:hypothetical protein
MAWIVARWEELNLLFQVPHWGAVGFSLVFALFWTRLGPPLRLFRLSALIAFGVGIVLFPITVIWLQPDVQSSSRDLLISIAGQESVDGRPLLAGAYSSLVRAAAQEIVLLFGILLVVLATGRRRDRSAAVTIGVLTALGYALFESVRFVTPALEAGLSAQSALPLVRELFLVGAHVGAGMILARAWIDGRFVRYFAIAALLHAALAYEAVLQVSGWSANSALAYLSAVATLAFFWGLSIATGRR